MKAKKECVAMLLAGGQGSRLKALTRSVAKPAVPFGGKYRIIDFTLSNCINSGIDTVGVLTQYQPLVLNEYVGNGQPWDLDRTYGGVSILPPYQAEDSADWYKGTANAIYQNLRFIERYDPEYVLVLSGDHIYTMDYGKMLTFHRKNDADCTIAVINVPKEDVSRFGILSSDEEGRIT
ncbi:MAG: NTP transferase domain-containing protein, partial [Clostridia bacterium]|nr:NTP transferase domain-containing protein [Clostridia bacterium]